MEKISHNILLAAKKQKRKLYLYTFSDLKLRGWRLKKLRCRISSVKKSINDKGGDTVGSENY